MRAASILAVVAACSPDIASGTYFCGPEMSCPPDESCNGSDNTCMVSGSEMGFACDPKDELHEPDNSQTQAFAMPTLSCVSSPYQDHGCLKDGDGADWSKLSVPSTCTAVEVDLRITFPLAYEPVTAELWDAGANMSIATAAMCSSNAGIAAGDAGRCLTKTVTPGGNYAILVRPEGGGECAGRCAFNRYVLNVQLATPQ